jgi:heparan-alpha-glucosaminide N-acetyltransferase
MPTLTTRALSPSVPVETPATQASKDERVHGPAVATTTRLLSLDAYRGFIMAAMVSAGFGFSQVARQLPDYPFWQLLGFHFDHVAWAGCAFWDLIQPSFMFMVGVALPYSHASRKARGQSTPVIAGHVVYRAWVLIFLGIFLSSNWSRQTDWVFTNVLTQIGLGYCFVYLLVGRGSVWQLTAVAVLLVGYWVGFLVYPLPAADFPYASVGFATLEPYTGLFAHWNPNTNAAAAFDDWFLNLFPRPQPFVFNRGGYATLNFVPSMATMILGLWAGELLRRRDLAAGKKLLLLVIAALLCGSLGWVLGETVCPIVKRIWTPSWTLYSAGWTFALLAGFYAVIDLGGWRKWAVPLVAVGMNSIAVYCMAQLLKPWVRDTCKRHLGADVFHGTYFGLELFDPLYVPVAECVVFLGVVWLTAVWMYRRSIFLKI